MSLPLWLLALAVHALLHKHSGLLEQRLSSPPNMSLLVQLPACVHLKALAGMAIFSGPISAVSVWLLKAPSHRSMVAWGLSLVVVWDLLQAVARAVLPPQLSSLPAPLLQATGPPQYRSVLRQTAESLQIA
jgi:hypothetical protein